MDKNLLLTKTVDRLLEELTESFKKGKYEEARLSGLAALMCIEHMDKEFVEECPSVNKIKLCVETLVHNSEQLIGV